MFLIFFYYFSLILLNIINSNARVEIEHMLMMLNLMLNVNPSPLTLQYMSKPHPLQYPDLAVRELAKKKVIIFYNTIYKNYPEKPLT